MSRAGAASTAAVPLDARPLPSRWRLLAAAGAVAEAAAHIPVTEEHLHEAPYIGVGFVLLTVAGFLLAQLLLVNDTKAVWRSVAAVAGLALLGYVLSRSVGLPQIGDDVGNWTDPLGLVAITGEAVMLVATALHFGPSAWQRRSASRRRRSDATRLDGLAPRTPTAHRTASTGR